MSKLEFAVRGPDAPGYLKMMRTRASLFSGDPNTPEYWDALLDFILSFVSKPSKKKARAILENATEAEVMAWQKEIGDVGKVSKNT